MTQLTWHDLQFALIRTPKPLLELMKSSEFSGKVFIGGGFLRSIVSGEPVNDIDVFVSSKEIADKLAMQLFLARYPEARDEEVEKHIYRTENAATMRCYNPPIQIIHRWLFNQGPDVSNSFDFTICCASFWWAGKAWESYCDERFYPDLAAKRLIYRKPIRNEDAGGSMLRVLKYYQKGYRIPLDSLAAVIGRLMRDYKVSGDEHGEVGLDEDNVSRIVSGLLREVDPAIDPTHAAHLPAESL